MFDILNGEIIEFQSFEIFFKTSYGIYTVEVSLDFSQNLDSLLNKEIQIHSQFFLKKVNDNLSYFKIYGFLSLVEKKILFILMKISGIGIKKAIQILQKVHYKELIRFVLKKDIDGFSKIKTIGKKAEHWIPLLYPKIKKLEKADPQLNVEELLDSKEYSSYQFDLIFVQSLENLGFKNQEIKKAKEKIEKLKLPQDIEIWIKKALTILKTS